MEHFERCVLQGWRASVEDRPNRKGVCYIGLAFKQDGRGSDPRSACCAAQMFLDSGDGVVFKGAVGPWYSPCRGEFHLGRQAAQRLVSLAIETFSKDPKK